MLEIIFIVLVNVLFYWRTLKFSLIIDDTNRYKEVLIGLFNNENFIKKLPGFLSARFYGGGSLAYKNKDGKWTIDTVSDHALSIFIHTLICVMIYVAFGMNEISLFASLLYSVNPANMQTSIWLNGRRYALSCLIVLCMIALGNWGMILYPLIAIFQMTAIFAPLVYGNLFIVAVLIILFSFRNVIKGKISDREKMLRTKDLKEFHPKKIIVVIKLYGLYFLKMLFPRRAMMIYPNFCYWGLTEEGNKDAYSINFEFLLGIFFILLSAVGIYLFSGTPQVWWFLFMIVSVLQWCGIISVFQIFADRYISAALPFAMYFLVYAIFTFGGFYAIPICGIFTIFYICKFNESIRMFKSMEEFNDYHNYHWPENSKFREFKSVKLIKKEDPIAAWQVVKDGLVLNPNDMKLNMLAAQIMSIIQDKHAAIEYLKKAKENCYINQEDVFDKFMTSLVGLNVKKEKYLIDEKKSKLDRHQRELVNKIYFDVYGE